MIIMMLLWLGLAQLIELILVWGTRLADKYTDLTLTEVTPIQSGTQ